MGKFFVILFLVMISWIGFGLVLSLFQKYGREIIVISDVGNPKLASQEISETIIALLHCYSMSLYSKRREKKKMQISVGSERKKGTSKELTEFIDKKEEAKEGK